MRAKLSADGKRLIADGHHFIATFERAHEAASLAESFNKAREGIWPCANCGRDFIPEKPSEVACPFCALEELRLVNARLRISWDEADAIGRRDALQRAAEAALRKAEELSARKPTSHEPPGAFARWQDESVVWSRFATWLEGRAHGKTR